MIEKAENMNEQELRAWLEREGMVMTREQDEQVRQWLEANDAKMFAAVERGHHSVLIFRPGTSLSGAAESTQSLGEAVRLAQHAFDLRVIALVKSRSPVVGQA